MSSLKELKQSSDSEKSTTTKKPRVVEVATMMVDQTRKSTKDIANVNTEVDILAINAAIESARIGEQGRGFGVISDNMRNLSKKTGTITKELEQKLHEFELNLTELQKNTQEQKNQTIGTRLSDLSLTNIDLIDRNLFERTADVRWWAASGKLVRTIKEKSSDTISDACHSLSKILGAYTVYHDIVLCDTNGKIIANGASKYDSIDKDVSNTEWFQTGINADNNGYGFQSVHKSSIADNKTVLVYSAPIYDSKNNNEICGVLGAIFDWTDLSQTILNGTPLSKEEMQNSRICIVDDSGLVLADTEELQLQDTISIPKMEKIFSEKKGFVFSKVGDVISCYAHSQSPGYQKYKTGWHSLIIQKIPN